MIIAIDPGTTQSGYVHFDDGRVLKSGVAENEWLLTHLLAFGMADRLVIETMQANYAATVGEHVINTLIWIGRFQQQWHMPREVMLISRQRVKGLLCGNVKAKDSGVRQALIDKLGAPGTKKQPGPTYGVTSHAWQALAVAYVSQQEIAA